MNKKIERDNSGKSSSGARKKQHNNNSRGRGRQRSSHSIIRESPPEYRRQSKTSNQRITSWSYYHKGDVEIPEICVYSIDKRCMYEDTGCLRLHAKCTCQWQVIQDGNWFNLRNFHSEELENAFQDVTKGSIKITPLDPKLLGSSGHDMIKILGNGQWEADFENLTLKNLTSQTILTSKLFIRRLSTQSAAVSKSGKATKYEWFFCDSNKKWIKYGDVDSLGHNHLVPLVTSEEIELNFSSDSTVHMMFNNSLYRYQLDFKTMKQKNLNTGKERAVRRRPVKKQSTKPNPRGKKENLPSTWDSMKVNDTMIKVSLDVSSQEYRDVMSQLLITVPAAQVVSIMRIQNPFLWRPFQNKQAELAIKYDGYEKLNIQKLFHGTRQIFIDDICKKNFDWRLHGSSTGQIYGRGSYFSNSAAYSLKYAKKDSSGHCYLFLVEVIIGEVTRGNESMKRPPLNPATGELFDTTVDNIDSSKIFVKYDTQEYYPLYTIQVEC